jgi:hypothetical protein
MVGTRSLSSGARSRDPLALPTRRRNKAAKQLRTTGNSHITAMRKLPVVPFCRMISVLSKSANQKYIPAIRPRHEGRSANRHDVRRGAVDAINAQRRSASDASDKAVWSRHPDAGVNP